MLYQNNPISLSKRWNYWLKLLTLLYFSSAIIQDYLVVILNTPWIFSIHHINMLFGGKFLSVKFDIVTFLNVKSSWHWEILYDSDQYLCHLKLFLENYNNIIDEETETSLNMEYARNQTVNGGTRKRIYICRKLNHCAKPTLIRWSSLVWQKKMPYTES